MTCLRYIGPIDSLSIPDLGLTIGRGDVIDVDPAAAARLLEQTDFEPAEHPSTSAEDDNSSPAGEPDASPTTRRRSTRS